MRDIAAIRSHIERCRVAFLAAAGGVPADKWRQPPGGGCWSAAEVVVHVTQVERAIVDGARKLLAEPPRQFSLWSRVLRPPFHLAQWRGPGFMRRKSPIPLDATLVADREPMLARLAEGRAVTLALLEETKERDLRAWRWKHPFFGPLSYYEWMRTLGYHDLRHAKQIREIVDSLQK